MTENYRVPVTEEHRKAVNEIAKMIQERLPPGYGFGLLVFEFGEADGRALTWISNADRSDMCKAMAEFISTEGN